MKHSHHYFNKPPYTERYVRWCERTDRGLTPIFLLDFYFDIPYLSFRTIVVRRHFVVVQKCQDGEFLYFRSLFWKVTASVWVGFPAIPSSLSIWSSQEVMLLLTSREGNLGSFFFREMAFLNRALRSSAHVDLYLSVI